MGKISDCAYKQEHNEERGIWFPRPDAPEFEHHKNINAIISDNAYKKKAQEMKGKVHIPHDLAEYARINKLQSEISDVNYKKGVDHTGVKMSFESLGLEHNAKVQEGSEREHGQRLPRCDGHPSTRSRCQHRKSCQRQHIQNYTQSQGP